MPPPRSLDDFFEKDHYTAERFAGDFPRGVEWTIAAVSQEQVGGGGRKKEDRPVLWFRESEKFIELNNPLYEFLRFRLGPIGDGSAWKDAVVTLRAIDGEGFGGEGFGIRAVAVQPPRREPPRVPRKFGEKVAAKVAATLSELGTGIDELTAWLRRHEPAAYEAVAGKEMSDWLDAAIPAVQKFTAEKRKAKAEAASPAPTPPDNLPAAELPPEDDIPF